MNALTKVELPENPPLWLEIDPSISFDDWLSLGRRLLAGQQRVNWWIGDWWAFGGHQYGRRAEMAAEGVFGKEFQSLADIASVCRSFQSSRRREVLSFTHHREVAALPPEEADTLLDKAEAEGLSTRELRKEVMAYHLVRSETKRRDVTSEEDTDLAADMFTMDEKVIALAESLGKQRALTEFESQWLETSWRKLLASFGRQTEEWDGGQDLQVKVMLRDGRSVADISRALERTTAAIRRRINKLGGIRRILEEGSVETQHAAE